ncbi:MAG: hypothetical protein IJV64_09615, partial [Oscillospiraceae bacterium]|nr:hypothetical protein [Oscillospiraceae bacterium]
DAELRAAMDYEAMEEWLNLEDDVCVNARLIFSNGSSFSTGGILEAPFQDGVINCHCSWKSAIDINAVERIVLGDQVLWEKG